ncbi:hypothetical protein K504DRAFT_501633 [Pleomassaria siparia CBS 279.74]|uniref:Uncharacterized protein n=1 Tax=Pleomassaria siparia CBS 279.74 TaxID=1314801 RepID=A0A6G1KD41_9PLEO|nr:hypothetical protein K504DRAFT_501633 [Pleomassaria siparia CBS 279.74]
MSSPTSGSVESISRDLQTEASTTQNNDFYDGLLEQRQQHHRKPFPNSRSWRPELYALQRRRSGPATLQTRIERARSSVPRSPIRSQPSYLPTAYDGSRHRSGIPRTFRNSQNGIHGLETPNLAMMDPTRNLRHQHHPALLDRPELRDAYSVAPSSIGIGLGIYHGSQDSTAGSQPTSPVASRKSSDGTSRQLSQGSSTFSRRRARHSPEMGQWFSSNLPIPRPPTPPPIARHAPYPTRPRPTQGHEPREPLNPNPYSPKLSRITRRLSPSTGLPTSVPRAPTKKYWPARFYAFFSTQPSSAEPNEHGDPFLLKLEHDIAPVHWLLRTLQFVVWLGIFGVYMWQAWKPHRKLAFDCFELKSQMIQEAPPSNGTVLRNVPSGIEIPPEFVVNHQINGTLCLLTPLVAETALFDNFRARWIIGTMCVGIANLVQVLLMMTLRRVLKRSGAYGSWTLAIRVFGGLLGAMVGSAIVMQWVGVVIKFGA